MNNKIRPLPQQGYAFVLIMAWLGVITLGVSHGGLSLAPNTFRAQSLEAVQLNDERDRLIYYAVDYANLYGPGGAGPGHLPCPDTDVLNERPGPNPPCAQAAIAEGLLPDGVFRPTGRIAFADAMLGRSSYRVDRAVVNNPSQGIGFNNWPQLRDWGTAGEGYAILMGPGGQARAIGVEHLKVPVHRWVQAWFVGQLLSRWGLPCRTGNRGEDGFPVSRIGHKRIIAICTTGTDPLVTSTLPSVCPLSSRTCLLSARGLLDWVLGPDALEWQGVPIARHWFVSNGWLNAVQVELYLECAAALRECAVTLDHDHNGISIKWLPMALVNGSDSHRWLPRQ